MKGAVHLSSLLRAFHAWLELLAEVLFVEAVQEALNGCFF